MKVPGLRRGNVQHRQAPILFVGGNMSTGIAATIQFRRAMRLVSASRYLSSQPADCLLISLERGTVADKKKSTKFVSLLLSFFSVVAGWQGTQPLTT